MLQKPWNIQIEFLDEKWTFDSVFWRLAYRSCFPAKNKWSDISLCIKVLTLDWHLPLTAMLGECVTFETLVAYPQATGHLSKFSRLLLGLFSSKAVTPPPELQLALNGLLLVSDILFAWKEKSVENLSNTGSPGFLSKNIFRFFQ